MKILTVVHDDPNEFDNQVNLATAAGYLLERREVVVPTGAGKLLHYAALVQLDPEPEPEVQPIDPIDAVRAIKATCDAMPLKDCQGGRCPLYVWCCQLEGGHDPSDWDLPEKEAPEA